jgi:cob(I)alamin adenosyltransferase
MKVTTKTGDQGQTGVFNQRVEKDSLVIDLLGHLDEVMAQMIDDFSEERVAHLEEMIRLHNEKCYGFVYPFDNPMKAKLNILRTVVRRCERVMVRAFKENTDFPLIRVYMNRLSDYVFILINR